MLHLEEVIVFTFIYFLMSLLFYIFLPKFIANGKNKVSDTHIYYSYYPSWIHAFISLILISWKFSKEGIALGSPSSEFSKFIVAHSLGYFIHDTLKDELIGLNQMSLRFHHILVLVAFSSALISNYGSCELVNGLFLAEISNIFQVFWFILVYLNLRNNKVFQINEALFAGSFTILRTFFGPGYSIRLFGSLNTPFIIKIFGLTLNSLGTVWISEVVSTIGLKLFGDSTTKYGIHLKQFFEGLKKSIFTKILFASSIIIPQVIFSIHAYLNRI